MASLKQMLFGFQSGESSVIPGLNFVQAFEQQTLGHLTDQIAIVVEQVLLPCGYILFAVLRLAGFITGGRRLVILLH